MQQLFGWTVLLRLVLTLEHVFVLVWHICCTVNLQLNHLALYYLPTDSSAHAFPSTFPLVVV